MNRPILCFVALVCLASGWPAATASAQPADSALGGRVVNEAGEGLAGARVFARRDGTKVRRSTLADAEGFYVFPALPPGDWDVEAAAHGHSTAVVGDVRLVLGQTRRLDLELEPSDAQEMVSFFDYQPLIRTGPEVSESVDRWELEDLPLRDRSLRDVSDLAPLVPVGSTGPIARLDGGLMSRGVEAPLSSIREASLADVSHGVEFSGATGVVSLLTRTGGAAGTGSAFVLHRDDDLEDNPDVDATRSHVGATYGGPFGRQSSKRGTHVFGAAEAVFGDVADERGLLLRGSRHDRGNLLRLRFLHSDLQGDLQGDLPGDPQGTESADSLLLGWQTQVSMTKIHDFLVQVEDLEPRDSFQPNRSVQLRSDLYVTSSAGRGLHDLAFGVESVHRNYRSGSSEAWSLYARDRWQVGDRLQLTGGLRSDTFDIEDPSGGRSRGRFAPRAGLVWQLNDDGSQLLRGGAGRFHDLERGVESDQFSLGWSWQLGPFVGVSLDALSVDSGEVTKTYDAFALTVRSRLSDVFQVRASFSRIEPEDDPAGEAQDRTVVTGLYQAPADVVVAAVYRKEPRLRQPQRVTSGGLDLRLAKGVSVAGDVSLELLAEVFDVFEEQGAGSGSGGRVGQLGLRLTF